MKKTRRWAERLRAIGESNPFLKHVFTLLSGTVVAQIMVFGISLLLARVYTDADFGRFALYMSIASMVTVIASGRYDMTIMLPKKDLEARVLKRLATRLIIVFSIGASLVSALFLQRIINHYDGDKELGYIFLFMGVTVFLVAELAVLQYWFNRKSNYKTIAINRVQQSVGSALGQLVFGLIGIGGVAGLFIGQTLGQLGAWINLRHKAVDLRHPLPIDAPSKRKMARQYIRMPLLNGPNAIVDAIRLNGINLLIAEIAVNSLGQFYMAWRILEVPVALINGAIAQVFFQKLATVEPGDMTSLVLVSIKRSAMVGIIPFTLLYLFSPQLFPFVFGNQWEQAGLLGRALVPWLFMMLISSPISQIFVVTETQHWLLAFSIAFCVMPLALLYYSPWDLQVTITYLGLLMAGMLVIMLFMAVASARRFDKGN
ncbi:MAG: RfbX [Actinobacteria bacterium]|nr:MAG: RfbX [Actinomycetota bacterium]